MTQASRRWTQDDDFKIGDDRADCPKERYASKNYGKLSMTRKFCDMAQKKRRRIGSRASCTDLVNSAARVFGRKPKCSSSTAYVYAVRTSDTQVGPDQDATVDVPTPRPSPKPTPKPTPEPTRRDVPDVPEDDCVDADNTGFQGRSGAPLTCEDLAPYCEHTQHGADISAKCPVTCGQCTPGEDDDLPTDEIEDEAALNPKQAIICDACLRKQLDSCSRYTPDPRIFSGVRPASYKLGAKDICYASMREIWTQDDTFKISDPREECPKERYAPKQYGRLSVAQRFCAMGAKKQKRDAIRDCDELVEEAASSANGRTISCTPINLYRYG